ncbi:Receptor kinase-like protein Xa21 [Camellia lanceoleosa]|uniref:Receptor kinase-like protein Xa21 n=1 Tax=Camellia lanceoleosa TaxID=1840588 RepID=A0ACC0HKN3_9ERIC|nr:Receptor kinase-like protein Xa21 [Camellia lanceoleosa]
MMNNLRWLNFQYNHLGTGEAGDLNFLSSLPNATNLNYLGLNSNNFGGVLPESIGNLSTNLGILFLDNNKIGGSIPTEMANLVNLLWLDMSDNHFIGNILADIGKLQKLQNLDLSANMIGMGSFGSVYKGILDHGEKVVAVKVLNLQFRGASKSFSLSVRP